MTYDRADELYSVYKDQNIDFPLRCNKLYLERFKIDKSEHFQKVLKIAKNHFENLYKLLVNEILRNETAINKKITDEADFHLNQLAEFFQNLDYTKDLK